ncbi:MAG: replication-relaxation family protein [Dehalobacterium sp.]
MLIEYEIELLERDKEVMAGIAKTKTLTANQIMRLYFNGKRYAYQRMKQLEKTGFVTSRPHVERDTGRKKGTCYYLTDVGFNVIGRPHYNPRLLIEPRKHDYREKVSEIFTQLTPIGWNFAGSVEAKEENSLNRNAKLICMLSRKNPNVYLGKEEYGVYLLSENPMLDTINKIQAEISKNEKVIKQIIALHQGEEINVTYNDESGQKTEWTDHLGMYRLHMMQYEKGLKMLRLMVDPDYIAKPPFINAMQELGIKYIGPESSAFSDHLVEYSGRKCSLVELASNDLTTIYHLRQYSKSEAIAKDRMVVILAPENELGYWKELFPKKHYPHMEVLPIKFD